MPHVTMCGAVRHPRCNLLLSRTIAIQSIENALPGGNFVPRQAVVTAQPIQREESVVGYAEVQTGGNRPSALLRGLDRGVAPVGKVRFVQDFGGGTQVRVAD